MNEYDISSLRVNSADDRLAWP